MLFVRERTSGAVATAPYLFLGPRRHRPDLDHAAPRAELDLFPCQRVPEPSLDVPPRRDEVLPPCLLLGVPGIDVELDPQPIARAKTSA